MDNINTPIPYDYRQSTHTRIANVFLSIEVEYILNPKLAWGFTLYKYIQIGQISGAPIRLLIYVVQREQVPKIAHTEQDQQG